MFCKTPNTDPLPSQQTCKKTNKRDSALGAASFGFIIGDVTDLLSWSEDHNVTMEYFEDPEYYFFDKNTTMKESHILLLKVSGMLFVSFLSSSSCIPSHLFSSFLFLFPHPEQC